MHIRSVIITACCLSVFIVPVRSQDATSEFTAEQATFFKTEVVELLTENCLKCHSGDSPEGGLNLTRRAAILDGGESGPAVDLKTPQNSLLLQAINYDGYEMPPTGQMSPGQIATLTTWVESGLAWPSDLKEIHFEAEAGPPQVNDENKQFWSFQPLCRPDVPQPDQHPIDAFVRKKLESAGLQPSPAAEPIELVRRMHYGVLGLPPEPEFAARWAEEIRGSDGTLDSAAIARLTEELLASAHYGEHWGRHWLDLVRYAETNSYERDGAKPHVWRYRDYVIRSFNADKPYDQFIREQLAGDELPAVTADSMIATGYYRLGRWDDEPADPKLAFYHDIDDIVTTTSQTFLGLTVNCARCHDHKIDPIPQRDYYRMVAFFRNVRRYGVRSHETVLDASVDYIDVPQDERQFAAAKKKYQTEVDAVRERMKKIEDRIVDDLQEVEKEEFQHDMNKLPIVAKREGTLLSDRQVKAYRRHFEQLKKLRSNKPRGLASALVVKEHVRQSPPTYILTRGNPHAEGEEVTPGFPAILSPPELAIPAAPKDAKTSRRRIVLANWIADGKNPLTARVMVNRIWQYHFGRGIVRTSSDFGFQGTAPTHPELLDWLAAEFVKSGWSVKAMHRLIMSSATYQQSSRPNAAAYKTDPTNDLFWRFDMRRLSAEEIRDSILWANGSLNSKKMFGPAIYSDIPDAVKAGQSRPGSGWGKSSPEDEVRRSVYIHVKRSLLDPLLESFDFADTDQPCPVRFVTTQPTQALGLMNSEFAGKQAEIFAQYLVKNADKRRAQVRLALTRTTQRPPSDAEIERGLDMVERMTNQHNLTEQTALKYLCLVALNMNEFIYVD